MAELVGLVASVAALAELTLKVFTNLYRLYGDVRGPAAELRNELGLMLGVIDNLKETIRNDESSLQSYHRSLEGAVAEFVRMVEEMEKRIVPEQINGIKILKWPFTEGENKIYLERIERYKGTINIAMNAKQL